MAEKKPEAIIAELGMKIARLSGKIFGATEEEAAKLKEEIAQLSAEMRREAQEAARAAVSQVKKHADTDGFWDLGEPKPRMYKKPDFDGHTIDTTVVHSENEYDGTKAASAEKIPPRSAYVGRNTERRTTTASYRRNMPQVGNYARFSGNSSKIESKTVCEYSPGGTLINHIAVRTWESGSEFYGRFTKDALTSHKSVCRTDPDSDMPPVPFTSYVPQYAHMSSKQMEYYRWVRENIRRGRFPDCDLGYIQLYIYEIFNLPDVISPENGAKIIGNIWLSYRGRHPRLDGYLCEWFADYCMINKCSPPQELQSIFHEITPKAQFKEFYLDPIVTRALNSGDSDSVVSLGKTVIEVSSDYDYTSSRYYSDNREIFEHHIPTAVGRAICAAISAKESPFSLERVYKMTRDSFCGAIISSAVKKRVDIEFSSFTRRADVREALTLIAKYSENKVRVMLGIKSKLRVEGLSKVAEGAIDEYFRPHLPTVTTVDKEDRYMPADYLKLYESEDSGFDFSKAEEIERQSWVNTERLTGEEYVEKEAEYSPDVEVVLDGEITDTDAFDTPEEIISEPADAVSVTDKADDSVIKDGLAAAIGGHFREYCRENSLYEGEAADRINTLFIDIIGDIVLEDTGAGYQIIEDYREEIEDWLQMQ